MHNFCFQSHFGVSNVHFLLPISIRCFQCTNFVSNLIFMFPMYFFCFQSISMFPIDNVSNPCFETTYYPSRVIKSHVVPDNNQVFAFFRTGEYGPIRLPAIQRVIVQNIMLIIMILSCYLSRYYHVSYHDVIMMLSWYFELS